MDFEFNLPDKCPTNEMEIVSIGAVITDNKGTTLEKFDSYIKPLKYPTMGRYYTKLTKITQEDIDNARLFPNVISDFCKIVNKHRVNNFFVFGSEDKTILRREIKRHNYKGSFIQIYKKIVDIQPEISKNIKYKNELIKKKWGLFDLTKVYSIDKYTKQNHNALVDALMLKDIYFSYINEGNLNYNILKESWKEKKEREKRLLEERKKHINTYLSSTLQIEIKRVDLSNFYSPTKDFLMYLKYSNRDIVKIKNCTDVKIIFNNIKKEINIYFLLKGDIKLLANVGVNVDNFSKVKKYVRFLKQNNKYIKI